MSLLPSAGALGPIISIRTATSKDLDQLVLFCAAMAKETEGRELDLSRLRDGVKAVLQSRDRGFYLVAESSTGIIGQLLITYEWSDWRDGVFWWIQSVYVEPAHRRQGVYRRLHQHVLKEARERGDVCGVRLYVEQANTKAQTAYTRLGLAVTPYRIFEQDFVL
jgi:ribosomal protein S18 acetylase RimI-like enzyme